MDLLGLHTLGLASLVKDGSRRSLYEALPVTTAFRLTSNIQPLILPLC